MPQTPKPIELGHVFELFIPTQCRCGKPLPELERGQLLDEVKSTMADWFGGTSTSTKPQVDRVEGGYLHDDGDLAKELVDVVRIFATDEAFESHREDFSEYVASLADRLTQEMMLCRVDGKRLLYPSGADTRPHRCMGGEYGGELPMPLQPDELSRRRSLQAAVQGIESVRNVRDLFCNLLHYEYENEELPTVSWPDKLTELLQRRTSPQIIADQNGFKIIYLRLAADYLRRGHERPLIQRIMKDDPTLRGLFVVSDCNQTQWHLVNAKYEQEEDRRQRLHLRRMRVGRGQSVRTAVERLERLDIELAGESTTAAQLQILHNVAFDVESVSKAFFAEISNWYFWALSEVKFPTDLENDDDRHRATSLIRLLTRIIFCWFLKEKRLIPDSLFQHKQLADILVNLDDESCTYHQAILQNLFFATLNQRMGKDSKGKPYRAFAKDEGLHKNKKTYGVDTLYRYEKHFQDQDSALSHFADIPFLNGGLFECLDRIDDKTGTKLYVDGFSRGKKNRAHVPNRLFFAAKHVVDLSGDKAYGETRYRQTEVKGLLRILHAYNFTIEENTPIDEEIALDPELLGKVFENLLASYNPETKTTARKQTGSFYTPRPIVEYMVDESLKSHLTGALTGLGRDESDAHEQLDLLLGYTDEEPSFSESEIVALLNAIHTCKILDPACGSGAFPMGMLNKLVHIVHKLDPENDKFEEIQLNEAKKIPVRTERRKRIEQIGKDFSENNVDYGRKLYLIENCLYGVDIQPIAIQISKLRFFISLICDQKTNRDKAKNHNIRALPNLETKFVAADTLSRLPELDQMELVDKRVYEIEAEIESLYHLHFTVQRRDKKLKLQAKLKELRRELGQVLSESLGSSQKGDHLAQWNPFDPQSTADFFDPHWMFGKSLADGFDIVIGNPPYIDSETMVNIGLEYQRAIIATQYDLCKGNWDIYIAFFECGLKLLNGDGTLAYITPDKWLSKPFGHALRKEVAPRMISIFRSGRDVFDSVNVDSIVCIISRAKTASINILDVVGNDLEKLREVPTSDLVEPFYLDQYFSPYFDFIQKLEQLPNRLCSFGNAENACATSDAYKLKELVVEHADVRTDFYKVINTGTIGKYRSKWGQKKMTYLGLKLDNPVVERSAFHAMFPNSYGDKPRRPKIVIKGLNLFDGCLDEDGSVVPGKTTLIVTAKSLSLLKSLLCILNTPLPLFYFREKYPAFSYNKGTTFTKQMINEFPIPELSVDTQKKLVSLSDEIVESVQNNDEARTIELQSKINQVVAELYGFTIDECELLGMN